MLCTPFLASRQAQLCAKCDHLLHLDDKLSLTSLWLEIFRRLNAISFGFDTPNAMHASFNVETIRPVWKMPQHTRFRQQTERYFALVGDISTFKRYFHCILHTECYARLFFILETCPTVRKIRPFTRFWWQTVRYIGPVGDISTFKRCFHCF